MSNMSMSISFRKDDQHVSMVSKSAEDIIEESNMASNATNDGMEESDSVGEVSEVSAGKLPTEQAEEAIEVKSEETEELEEPEVEDVESKAESLKQYPRRKFESSFHDDECHQHQSAAGPTTIYSIFMSPTIIVVAVISIYLVAKLSSEFLLGFIMALVLVPFAVYFLVRYYLSDSGSDSSLDETYLETATKTETEISGWLFVKEANGEKKSAYARLRDRQLKLSYKDGTSKVVELTTKHKLQLVSPYIKNKKRLKHLWTKNLPMILSSPAQNNERVILYFREAKQKETWFWALYPLFFSYDDQQQFHEQKEEEANSNNSDAKDWFNRMLDRAFRDLLSHPKWRRWVRRKCQHKLRRLALPKFVDRVRVKRVALSQQFPKLTNPTGHRDSEGQALFSFELDASTSENGSAVFEMTLETRLNASFFTNFREGEPSRASNPDLIGLSDEEDEEDEVSFDTISTTSDEEDEQFEQLPFDGEPMSYDDEKSYTNESAQQDRELMDMSSVSSIASPPKPEALAAAQPRSFMDRLRVKGTVLLNKNKTVRKYFDELVSSSQLTVTVKVVSLRGTLLLAQPVWPSDRLWFKMAPRPDLKLSVHLQHGTAGKPLIRSAWLKNLLEDRLRQHLVSILCTYDDVSLHPLLLLPNSMFYAGRSSVSLPSTLFMDKL